MPVVLDVQFQDVVKLLSAILVGGLLGAEREFHDKAAGLRTLILICLGSTLFTIFSVKLAGGFDPARIAAQIVTGIGFLGAGVILHERGRVRGLTTASTIWIAAALGIGIGAGAILFSLLAAGLALFVLWALPFVERPIERLQSHREYRIVTDLSAERPAHVARLFEDAGLSAVEIRRMKDRDRLVSFWSVSGRPEDQQRACEDLMADPDVKEFGI